MLRNDPAMVTDPNEDEIVHLIADGIFLFITQNHKEHKNDRDNY